ncbi:hypothetical protein CLV58_14418 [Spirosoma oryzae]|uniref:Uncharacterized protein n=1 Tax=Spirosoma oryzae TaxID=1469603 RepID=A0A2T0RNL0_9BACT|nr:hypothetical protein [Spirosoma oryzae]PRY22738.1 hypothetical protein CLV58_14418 [Spirosoma oryzae]
MPQTDDEFIDEMLEVLYESDNKQPVYVHETLSYLFETDYRHTDEFDDLSARIRAELESQNLAEGTGFGTVMRITPFGRAVYKAGGWVRYNQQLAEEKQTERNRQLEAHQATLASAKATEDSARFASSSAKAAWFSGVVGAVAILISLYQLYKGNELEDKLNAVTKRVELTDSLMKVPRQSRTTSAPKGYRVSSDSSTGPAVPGSGHGRQEARR